MTDLSVETLAINAALGNEKAKNLIIKTRWTVAELYATTFPEPNWIIPGLIPPGLTFLAGRPKVGKSWMALQIAHSKATGGKFFGKDVPPGRVVYYAFEDRPSRIKERMTLQGVPMTAAIEFDTERIRLQSGGIERIQRDIEDGISLIVIDTLSRAFGMTDQDDLAEMTVQTGYLQELAQDSNIGLLVIDHHKKPNGFNNDPIDDIIGSTGKAATADAAIGLYRSNGRKEVVLKAVGRDFDDVELSLEWDGAMYCWHCLGKADDVREDTRSFEIITAIRNIKALGEPATTARISQIVNMDRGNVSHYITVLLAKGKIIKGQKQGKEQPYDIP